MIRSKCAHETSPLGSIPNRLVDRRFEHAPAIRLVAALIVIVCFVGIDQASAQSDWQLTASSSTVTGDPGPWARAQKRGMSDLLLANLLLESVACSDVRTCFAMGSRVTANGPSGGLVIVASHGGRPPFVGGFAILTRSPENARSAFRYAGGLVHAVDLDLNRAPAKPVRSLAIGQGAELFSEHITSPCPAAHPQCPPFPLAGTAYAVVWWDGPALGVVEVVGVPGDRAALAVTPWGSEKKLGGQICVPCARS